MKILTKMCVIFLLTTVNYSRKSLDSGLISAREKLAVCDVTNLPNMDIN